MLVATDNSSSLHKQTRRNPLGRDVCSPVENHDLVLSLPDNSKSQGHSRVSECDGRPSVQVKPSPINRMVTTSAFKQICHKWFTPHVDLFATHLNHKFYCVNTPYLVDRCICLAPCRSRQTLEKNVLSWALVGTGSVPPAGALRMLAHALFLFLFGAKGDSQIFDKVLILDIII